MDCARLSHSPRLPRGEAGAGGELHFLAECEVPLEAISLFGPLGRKPRGNLALSILGNQ